MPSFDIESKTDLREVDNALQNVQREIDTRFDFKGSKTSIERKDNEITLLADDEYKREQVEGMIKGHITRRKLDAKSLEFKDPQGASGNTLRQIILIKQGIDTETAKKITKFVKESKLKVQASIQGDSVRVTGKKRDDLQEAIAAIKAMNLELPLQFDNFRE